MHLTKELEILKKKLLTLAINVEDLVKDSIHSLETLDQEVAKKVIASDPIIDEKEVEIEEDCLKVLALHNPVANDLRFVIASLKINNDLERVGDLAVNIAERVIFISKDPLNPVPFDFGKMAAKTLGMLRRSLDSFVDLDTEKANAVCKEDDDVDDMNRNVYNVVYAGIKDNPANAEKLIHYLSVSRHLERIADYATNICEDVIYMIEGKIVRHSPESYD